MRLLLQRVKKASVVSDNLQREEIGEGLLVFVAFKEGDTNKELEYGVKKVLNIRLFDDEEGVMNHSLLERGGELLLVSQFTLYGSAKRGNRPSYIAAAPAAVAIPLYNKFHALLSKGLGREVASGVFGADMKVSLVNDGPVTIWIDTDI